MADEFQSGICGGNWWESSRNRFDSGSSSTSSTLNTIGSFGWPADMVDMKARSSMDTVSETASSMVFQDIQKLQAHDSAAGSDSSGVLTDPNLQMMGLGLSSQAMDWNQTLLRSGKADQSSFRSMLQEDLSSNTNFQQETGMVSSQVAWRSPKMFSSGGCEDSSVNEYKQISRGFSLDQPQYSSHSSSAGCGGGGGGGGESVVTCQGLTSSFQMDYGNPSSAMLQGFLGSNHQPQQQSQPQPPMDYPYAANYGMNMNSNELLPSSMSKFPQFLRSSPPKQPPHNQLQLSNNAPFWNASAATMTDIRSSFFPSMQAQFSTPSFEEKPKPNTSDVRDSAASVAKKSSSEVSTKRPRNETPSSLPAFKVRKEKMGDRITALQQLVSPFGKTDTASVLSEAFEYIKFLHQQVKVLSTPYMKSGAPIQHQQNSDKSKDPDGPKQDLRSRGLCLVPVSSTFPVAHETHIDFYTPTFGGSFR